MTRKLSKSDTTPEDEARGREARQRFLEKRCSHFEDGSEVMYQNRRGTILSRFDELGNTVLRIRWQDGSVGHVIPMALN